MPAEPIAKTLVAEFKVTAADLHVRTQMVKAASSIVVPAGEPLHSVDVVVDVQNPYTIEKIDRFLAVVGYENFEVIIREWTGAPDASLPQKGLFITTGAIPAGVFLVASEPTRCTILYS